MSIAGFPAERRGARMGTVTVSRRTALKVLGSQVGAAAVWPYLSDSAAEAFARIQATNAPPALAFFTAEQYATIDALAETIIPADEHSPGARAARVADYIDLLLSESADETRRTWTAGLTLLDESARREYGARFAQLQPPQEAALLTTISRGETNPQTPLERFFKTTKDATIRGYYTSEIGIHKELQYQGNRVRREFAGCTHPAHGYIPSTG
jgi:hypothetical protein